ncbi:MAG TPA: hypothetical protein PK096_04895 [Candidatus Saccharibacteria bacterium]|mgnify:FL=1|nr:hypothetical protein [Candidatus Saccharibacteria bacterium]HRK94672.1 hypothetical protein [Candidatus Saccharibacteria bacterium]
MGRNSSETGSLASYIIVGVLLMVVLVSGLYGVQRYNQSQEGNKETGTNEPATNGKDTTSDDQTSDKPADNQSPVDDGSSNVPATDDADQTEETSTTAEEDLPATGPGDVLATAGIIAVVTYAAVSYVQSRRFHY